MKWKEAQRRKLFYINPLFCQKPLARNKNQQFTSKISLLNEQIKVNSFRTHDSYIMDTIRIFLFSKLDLFRLRWAAEQKMTGWVQESV